MVTLEALALCVSLLSADETVLLDFSAPWCAPCQAMEPTVARLERDGYPVRKISVDQQPELASRFQVTGVPCFVLLVNGQEVERVEGACSHARLVEMFAQAKVAQPPKGDVRLQSPDTAPSASSMTPGPRATPPEAAQQPPSDARVHAMQATVRLRVEDAAGESVGTGTIIDAYGNEALVVTCGHIFRDSQGRGRIHVDCFPQNTLVTAEGTVISYDLERDIGLVSFTSQSPVIAAKVAPSGHGFREGDAVFTMGCDEGRQPSLRESRITSLDRYLGPPNIETTGQPAVGRSGGGLFSGDGLLIGICNNADPEDDEGIYASLPTIHWELDRVGQRRIYQPNVALATTEAGLRRADAAVATSSQAPPEVALAAAEQATSDLSVATSAMESDSPAETEVICIVRSRGNSSGGEQVFVLDRPSPELLDRLTRESNGRLASLRGQQPTRKSDDAQRMVPVGPVVRAQSSDPQ